MFRRGLLFATILATSAAAADAQQPLDARSSGVDVRAARLSTDPFQAQAEADAMPAAQAASRKEPIVAGVLSWVIPGLGSHYAGHSKHGWTHLAVAGASLAIFILGASDCVDADYVEDCDEGLGLAVVGYLGLVVNGIWGIITAVNDANAYNKRGGPATGGQIIGDLYLEPSVRSLKSHSPTPGLKQTRTGVQLLSWKY